MAATKFDLEIEQGIPYKKKFLVRNEDNSLPNMTGWTARMQFRPYVSSSQVAVDASTANGKLIIDTGTSSIEINLSEADTTAFTSLKYVYDLELLDSLSKPIRLLQGSVSVSQEVTRN